MKDESLGSVPASKEPTLGERYQAAKSKYGNSATAAKGAKKLATPGLAQVKLAS
jgi:hypothetical protein